MIRTFILFFGILVSIFAGQSGFCAEASVFTGASESFVQNASGAGELSLREVADFSENEEKNFFVEPRDLQMRFRSLFGKSCSVKRSAKEKNAFPRLVIYLFTNLPPPHCSSGREI